MWWFPACKLNSSVCSECPTVSQKINRNHLWIETTVDFKGIKTNTSNNSYRGSPHDRLTGKEKHIFESKSLISPFYNEKTDVSGYVTSLRHQESEDKWKPHCPFPYFQFSVLAANSDTIYTKVLILDLCDLLCLC